MAAELRAVNKSGGLIPLETRMMAPMTPVIATTLKAPTTIRKIQTSFRIGAATLAIASAGLA
jgi:hypothetical protein